MQVKTEEFGSLPSGDSIKKFTLTNRNGVQVVLTNYGVTMMRLLCPDRFVPNIPVSLRIIFLILYYIFMP